MSAQEEVKVPWRVEHWEQSQLQLLSFELLSIEVPSCEPTSTELLFIELLSAELLLLDQLLYDEQSTKSAVDRPAGVRSLVDRCVVADLLSPIWCRRSGVADLVSLDRLSTALLSPL